jgi:predicted  nucleic acid-binding Zn-ribbon protein
MKATQMLPLVFFLLVSVAPSAIAASMDPLGKVFELMTDLEAKITKEGEEEAKAFNEYVEWCDDAAANLHNEIKTGTEKKEELEATISKCKADIEANSVKIEELSGSIAADEKELKEATAVREKEVATFEASEAELVDAIDTLERAVGILQKEMSKNPASLAQVDTNNLDSVLKGLSAVINAASFSANDQQKLTALVQQASGSDDTSDEFGAPAAAVYKTHSTSIFDVLEDMKEKAEGQLDDLRKAESNTKHQYNMLKQSLEDSIEADTKDMDEEKSLKAATEENKANAEGDLAETVKELAKDKASLEEASTTCMQVAADHEATMTSRKEELAAIATAEKVLKETSGGAVSQSYSLFQVRSKAASTLRSRADLKNAEVVNMVKKLAHDHHSAALAQLASRIGAVIRYGAADGDDVFAKVKGLISDMIAKLEKEAKEEATEKAYCDEEMSKTEAKKSELEGVISRLTSKIDLAAAKSAELKGEVKTLQAELATLAKEQAEMDKIRAEEKSAFDTAKAELELGITGVQKALGVLKDYYQGSAALLQNSFDAFMQQPAKPKKHSKASGAGGSIIDILEVVESDFTKNLAAEETEEADAIAVYEKTTQDNKLAVTMKSQDVKYKTKEYKGLDKSISELSGDRDTTNTELSAVLDYYAKIKDRCIAKPESYEERKARREAEINGLKEALQILEDETAFVQRGKHSNGRHRFLAL